MPPLGYIERQNRTQLQNDAHDTAERSMVRFTLAPQRLAKGEKLLLSSLWSDPLITQEMGFTFERFHQLTGSCIGASLGNGIVTLGCVQRKLMTGATKVLLPFWPFDYGRCRYNEGDRGQGEGAINSSAVDTMKREGVLICQDHPTLPQFTHGDGLTLTSRLEMQWSDGGSKLVTDWMDEAKVHLLGQAAPVRTAQDFYTGIINGYPGYFGCNDYVGGGSIKGSGDTAYVRGRFDGRGGHSTTIEGVWEHPNDGTLFLYGNNWPASTYPQDPAGGRPCSVWLPESEINRIFSQLDGDAYLLSSLDYFPAQPEVLNWLI